MCMLSFKFDTGHRYSGDPDKSAWEKPLVTNKKKTIAFSFCFKYYTLTFKIAFLSNILFHTF